MKRSIAAILALLIGYASSAFGQVLDGPADTPTRVDPGTQIGFTVPGNVGDIAVLCAFTSVTGSWPSPPTGWSTVSGSTQTSGEASTCVSKTLVSGDPGSTVNLGISGSGPITGMGFAVADSTGIDVTTSQHNAPSTTVTAPAVSGLGSSNDVLFMVGGTYGAKTLSGAVLNGTSVSMDAALANGGTGLAHIKLNNNSASSSTMTFAGQGALANAGISLTFLPRALSLGSITISSSAVSCSSLNLAATPTGANCYKITSLSCPNTDPITSSTTPASYVAITTASSPNGKAILSIGGTPTTRFFGATAGDDFLDPWVTAGYNVVQVAWGYDPENTWIGATIDIPGNMLYANCRTATLMDWVYRNETSGGNKICILAHSAGYGEALFGSLDYAGSGSNTRLDSEVAHFLGETGGAQGDPNAACTYGVHSDCAGAPKVNLCPPHVNTSGSYPCPTTLTGPYCFPNAGFIDSHDATTRCNTPPYTGTSHVNTLTDQQTWQASGLDTSTNAIPSFAITATTSMFQCNVNQEAGQFTFIGNILPHGNFTDFEVAPNSICNGTESYSMNVPGGLSVMITDMENNC